MPAGNTKVAMYAVDASGNVPALEAGLRAEIAVQNLENALNAFERLLRKKRTPSQTVCTQLLELCVSRAPRRA